MPGCLPCAGTPAPAEEASSRLSTSLLQCAARCSLFIHCCCLVQEARALCFNPRSTALSLATALLDVFSVTTWTWPDGLLTPLSPAASHDPAAGLSVDPAAQHAGALLCCAGPAVTHIGGTASHKLMTDMSLDAWSMKQPHVKQLMQSPSCLHLIITVAAVQARLQDSSGMQQNTNTLCCARQTAGCRGPATRCQRQFAA